MIAYDPFTEPWLEAFRREIDMSEEYREAAKGWVWPIVLALDPAHDQGHPEGAAIWLDLYRGDCRNAALLPPSEAAAPFVVAGGWKAWEAVLRGQLDPVAAIVSGRLRLTGALTTMMMHTRSAKALVDCASAVPTRFPE